MQLYVRLHNSDAGTGLLRCVNLLSSHALCRGQTSRCWPWSPGSISHGTRNQKWCRTEHARQSTYQSPCAQGWRDPRWRTPLIILNNTVTQWALVGDPTDWICCMTTQKCQFAALLCRQRDNAFWQNVSHEYEDFSCCHRNNDQDCKKQSKALLALPARLFFMKSIVSRPLEDYFSLFSFTALFFFEGLRLLLYQTLQNISILFPFWMLFLLIVSRLLSLSFEEDWHTSSGPHLQTCTLSMFWWKWSAGALLHVWQLFRLSPSCLCVCIKPTKVHPSIPEEVHSCVWTCARPNQKYCCSWHAWTFFIIFACVRKASYCSQNVISANSLWGLQSNICMDGYIYEVFSFYNIVKSQLHWERTIWK